MELTTAGKSIFNGINVQVAMSEMDVIEELASATSGCYSTYVDLNDYIDLDDPNVTVDKVVKVSSRKFNMFL